MNAFNNLRVGVRLIGGFLIVVIILLIVAVVGYINMKAIDDGAKSLYVDNMLPVQELAAAQSGLLTVRGDLYKILAIPEQMDATDADVVTNIAVVNEQMKLYRATILIQDEKDNLAAFDTAWAAYLQARSDFMTAVKANNLTAAKQSMATDGALYKNRVAAETALNNLIASNVKSGSDSNTQGTNAFNGATTMSLAAAILAVLIAMGLGIFLSRGITNPLAEAGQFLDTIAKGDISQDPSAGLLQRKDEIGALAQAMMKTTQYLRKNVKEMGSSAHALSSSATELSAISEQTSAGAKESAMKANSVAAAAEEMSANTVSVAAGMEQATTSLSSVATAVEEMTSTIGEIAKNSEKARYTTEQTAQQINQYAGVMRGLGQSAREIGKFTETIASISAQTNLLALNATIEAARAGAAGKGFAVVANEIKELAQQTAAATGEIKNKISAIQVATAGAVEDVEKIVHIIQEVNDSVSSTAAAIQEQATVTQDIAMNIAQASHGIKDANHRVAQTATVSRAIARDIASVSETAGQITDASAITQTSAADLSRLAEQLNQLTLQFII